MPDTTQGTEQLSKYQQLSTGSLEPDAPLSPANAWLKQNGWQRVWPKWPFGTAQKLTFGGAPTQRYLRLEADQIYYIWSRPVDLDPHQLPFLSITWGVDRLPHAALSPACIAWLLPPLRHRTARPGQRPPKRDKAFQAIGQAR